MLGIRKCFKIEKWLRKYCKTSVSTDSRSEMIEKRKCFKAKNDWKLKMFQSQKWLKNENDTKLTLTPNQNWFQTKMLQNDSKTLNYFNS